MRVVLLALILSVGVFGESVSPVSDYHDEVGFGLAASIRAAEEQLMAKAGSEVNVVESALSNDGNDNISPKIVGGAISAAGQFPYMAGLVVKISGFLDSACGSSLLTANRLVTAAHCWWSTNHRAWAFEVVMGSQFLFFGGTRIQTSQVTMHTQYTATSLNNDIAMIYLPQNVAFSQTIQPISLPSTTELWETFAGHWAQAIGYGKTSDLQTGVTQATQVSHVGVQVMTHAACQSVWGVWLFAGNVCTAGTGGVGICAGDSGGPLVVNHQGRNVLVGISSFVDSGGCQRGSPSVFIRITSYYNFIVSHLW